MPYLKTPRGLDWYYESEGKGLPILFLHGFGVNGRVWRQQIKHFSGSHRVISVDLPGHGRSRWQKVKLADMAGDLRILLAQLDCRDIGIVASSFGGLVALKILETEKSLVKFLVFAGSQPKFCRTEDYPYGLERERILKLAGQLNSDYPSMVHIFFRSLFTRQERETRRFKWVQTFRKTDFIPDRQALLELLGILESEDLRDVFYALDLPVLFINGTEDYICQKSFYDDLGIKMPSAKFFWFERCGHFPFISRPYEFNKAVQNFIEGLE